VAKMGDILKEICLITGLKVDEGVSKEFTKLFNKFIHAHYANITPSEIVLAFTLNAAGELPGSSNGKETDKIDFYGSSLTIEHVGGILFRYMQKRANLAKKIREEEYLMIEAPQLTKEEQEMEDKNIANEYYRKYINKEFSFVSPEYAHWIYDILDKFQLISYSVDQKKKFMEEAQGLRLHILNEQSIAHVQEYKEVKQLLADYAKNEIPISEKKWVINCAKRIALLDLFKVWKGAGKKRIFE